MVSHSEMKYAGYLLSQELAVFVKKHFLCQRSNGLKNLRMVVKLQDWLQDIIEENLWIHCEEVFAAILLEKL